MKIKMKNVNIFILLILIVAILPKANIISIPGISIGIRIDDLIVAILTVYLFIKDRKMFMKDTHLRKLSLVFGVYFFSCIISTIVGILLHYVSPMLSILYLFRKVEYFVFLYFGYKYFQQKDNKLFSILSGVIVFHLIICILQYFGILGAFQNGKMIDGLIQNRVCSTFNGAYELSAFLLLLLPIYLYDIFYEKKTILKSSFLTGAILFMIVLSESRISLITFFIIAFFMFFHFCIKKNKKYIFIMGITFLVCIIIFGVLKANNAKLLNRFHSLSFSNFIETTTCAWTYKDFDLYLDKNVWVPNYNCLSIGMDASWNVRINHWMQLIDGTIRSPLFGLGPSITSKAADGEYIRVLSESGMVGLLLWLYLLYTIIKLLNTTNNKMFVISKYALYGLMVGAIFIDVFSASKVMMLYWFLLGVAISSVGGIYEKRNNSQ